MDMVEEPFVTAATVLYSAWYCCLKAFSYYHVPEAISLFYKSYIFNTMLNLRLHFINLPFLSAENSYF